MGINLLIRKKLIILYYVMGGAKKMEKNIGFYKTHGVNNGERMVISG